MRVDLTTKYLGLTLASPFVAAASPLGGDLEMLKRLEDEGTGAVVLPSLFAEQIERGDSFWSALRESESSTVVPAPQVPRAIDNYNTGLDGYLKHIELAKLSVKLPIIGSINAAARGDWVRFARLIEQSGADALELNIVYIPTDPQKSSRDVEDQYVELVAAVRQAVALPLAVKLGPYFTALPHLAARLAAAGAQGLVLFNRYLEPDINLEALEVHPRLELSSRSELRLPLRWIAILRDQLEISLAATSGIHAPGDATKLILAGANVVMLASALIRHGPSHVSLLRDDLDAWLAARRYTSLDPIRGLLSRGRMPDASAFERANYLRAVLSYSELQR